MEEDLRKLLNEEKEKLAQMITTGSLSTTIELDLSLATETTIDDKESVSGIDAEEGREEQSGEREEEEEEAERNGQTEDGHEEREERLGGGEGIERVEIESEGVIEKVHQEILDQTIKDNVGDVADETEEQKREKLNGIEEEKDREEQERRSEEVKREERELESNRPRRQSGIIVTEEEVERKRKEAQERVKQRIARIEEERKRNTPNTQSPVVTRMETHDQDLTKDLEDLDDMLKQVDIEMDSPTQTALRKRIEEERRSKAEEEERRREEEARRIAAEDEDMNSLLEYQMQFKKKRESIRITHNIEEIAQQTNTIEENAAERVKADTNRTNRNQMDRLDSTVHTSSIGPDTAFKRDLQDYSRILEAETAAIIHSDHSSDEPVSFSANQDDQWLLRSLKEGEQDKSKPTEPELQTPVSAISNRYLAKHLTQSRVDAQPSPRFSGFVSPQLVPPVDLSSSIGSGANKNRSRSFGSQGKGRSKSNIFDFRQSLTLDNPLKVEQGTNMVYYVTHTKGRPSDQENICFTCGSRLETGIPPFIIAPLTQQASFPQNLNTANILESTIVTSVITTKGQSYQLVYFRPYPICDASKAFLELTVDDPVYDISAISSGLFYKVPNLRNVKILRRQLYYLKDYIFNCDRVSQEKVVKEISDRLHIIHNTDIYSLQDLMDLNTEKLIDWIRDLTERFIVHVTKHAKREARSVGFVRIRKCHTPYHRTCKRRSPNCCPICERSGQDGRWDASVDNDTDDIDTVQQFKSGLERGSSFRF
ncbi:hypothetical protein PROFUN_08874 [Planoprotostelium fungivorum]|nr:hypothetical protein PROFUN_08874 [Planoprotostelium fungivorum]